MELLSTFLCASLVAIIVYILLKMWDKNKKWWATKGVPILELPSLYSRMTQKVTFVKIDEHLYKQTTTGFGGFMEMFKPTLFLKDLDVIKNVYVKDFEYFVNRRNFKTDDSLWNDMLVNKCDREWKDLRATMSPTFSTGKIRRMFSIMDDSSKKLIKYLEDLSAKNDGIVEFEDAMGRFAMDVISSAAFGIESQVFQKEDAIVSKMAKKLQFKITFAIMMKFMIMMISPKLGKILGWNFVQTEGADFFKKIILDSIKQREASGEKRNDFLQLMIEVKNGQLETTEKNIDRMDTYEKDAELSHDVGKKNVTITDDLIVSNCILFIFGGFDTTQSALIFALYALALNQDVQENLRRELQDATEHTDGKITYDIINHAEYLDKVINETLRMYPPAMRTERRCTKDYSLSDKVVIIKDTTIAIPVYQIHHDEKYFPNPEVFDPERFSSQAKANRHPYAFMPFGHGPRNCIANRFALTETKAAISNLVLKFDIEPCAKTTIPIVFGQTGSLKPKDGLWLKLKLREK